MRWLPHLAVSTRLRLAFGLLAGLFAYIDHQLIEALPWVLLVMVLDLGASALAYLTVMSNRARRLQVFALIVAASGVAGVAMGYAGPWSKALLLIPAYHAGLRFAHRGGVGVPLVGVGTGLLTAWQLGNDSTDQLVLIALSGLLALLFGMLGAWSRTLEPEAPPVDTNVAAEAGVLLRRLHELADTLETGFDAPGSAEMALQDLAARKPAARSSWDTGRSPPSHSPSVVPTAPHGPTPPRPGRSSTARGPRAPRC